VARAAVAADRKRITGDCGMKRIVALSLVAVVLVSASGCSGPDALVKELILNLNQVADLIEKKEPKERIRLALERANNTAEKINKLKLNKEEQDSLFKRHDEELKAVTERLKAAQAKRKLEVGDDFPIVVVDDIIKK
jgi:hypothetical protein